MRYECRCDKGKPHYCTHESNGRRPTVCCVAGDGSCDWQEVDDRDRPSNRLTLEADGINRVAIEVARLERDVAGCAETVLVDVVYDADDMLKSIGEALQLDAADPEQRWAILDSDDVPYRLLPDADKTPTREDLLAICEYARLCDEYEDSAFSTWWEEFGRPFENAWETWEDNFNGYTYHGFYRRGIAEYAEQLTSERCVIDPSIECYIDYDRMGRDLLCDGYWDLDGHIFSCCN